MKTINTSLRLASFATSGLSLKSGSWRIIVLTAIFLLAFASTGSAEILNVSAEGNYTSIQAAIDNASNGDIISVSPGEYKENIVVNKQVTITSTNGSSVTSVIADNADEDVFNVSAGNVTIEGFSISGADTMSGIYVCSRNNALINNSVFSNEYGIRLHGINLYECDNNILINNTVYDNNYGIHTFHSNNNILSNNSMNNNTRNFAVIGYYGVENTVDTSNKVDGKPIYYLVDASDITIDSSSNAGTIYCISCKNITIKDVQLSNNYNGVYFQQTTDSRIENITVSHNRDGIALWYRSNDNVITSNVADDNDYGIALRQNSENNVLNNNEVSNTINSFGIQVYSDQTTLVGNNASDNKGNGITVGSNNNSLMNNIASNNKWSGIYIVSSLHNLFEGNTFSGNGANGLFLVSSSNNTLSSNTFSGNKECGILLDTSANNTITGNTVSDNDESGMGISVSPYNLIYNNLFNNTINVIFGDNSTENMWNTTLRNGTSIVGGDLLGGNYWAKPDGSGFSQNGNDSDGNGICNSPYVLGEGNIDYLPLNITHYNLAPVATIENISKETATEGEIIYFQGSGEDEDGTIESYLWNSTLDGVLSNSSNFSTDSLSPGTHVILFSVQDNEGAWSDEVSRVVKINKAEDEIEKDSTSPVLETVTPENGSSLEAGTDSLNIRFDYSDDDTGIYVSSVIFTFDGVDVSGENSTIIKQSYATYNATGLSAGTHSASVYVEDVAGNNATFSTQFTIQETKSSSGSSSGSSHSSSGGGGGSTSDEKYENILVKEVRNIFINKDAHISYEFSKEGNPITTVEFDSLKNSGTITSTIEVLKGTSSYAKTAAPETIYKQMNIWVGKSGFASSSNVEKIFITYKVEKSWMEKNGIATEDIVFYRYADSTWNALPVTVTGEDDTYVYFRSETPGFSAFAISGQAKTVSSDSSEQTNVSIEMHSVEENNTMTGNQIVQSTPEGSGNSRVLTAAGIMIIVLAGAYFLYRKKN